MRNFHIYLDANGEIEINLLNEDNIIYFVEGIYETLLVLPYYIAHQKVRIIYTRAEIGESLGI